MTKKSNNMFVTPKNHTRQNFKYELEESLSFKVIKTKQCHVFRNIMDKIYCFLV